MDQGNPEERFMGEQDRLLVDFELLESSKKNLQDIKRALNDIEEHRDDIRDVWGHDSIAGKMEEFVNNWDNYRRELLDNVEDLGKQVDTSLKSFEKLDLDLEKATEKKSGKNGGS
jgi:uncharacterized protein YukE